MPAWPEEGLAGSWRKYSGLPGSPVCQGGHAAAVGREWDLSSRDHLTILWPSLSWTLQLEVEASRLHCLPLSGGHMEASGMGSLDTETPSSAWPHLLLFLP